VTTPDVLDVVREAVPAAGAELGPAPDMPTLVVEREALVALARVLRDDPRLQFAFFVDVTAADYFPAAPRFELVYHLACLGEAYQTAPGAAAPPRRLRVKTRVPGDDARAPSLVSVYPAANWPEREVFDLFGIVFDDHPDLRRILMPEDWQGFPMRRDYPVQIRKDAQAWQPIEISAEEFAANVRAQREHAQEVARGDAAPPSANRRPGR
jgi:NADH-quinone oxidoreductase subunit C